MEILCYHWLAMQLAVVEISPQVKNSEGFACLEWLVSDIVIELSFEEFLIMPPKLEFQTKKVLSQKHPHNHDMLW